MNTYPEAAIYRKWIVHPHPDPDIVWYEDNLKESYLLTNDKISVDEGYFKPGVYRVNGYRVYREEMEYEYDSHHEFYTGGLYEVIYKGDLMGSAVNFIKNKTRSTSTLNQLKQEALLKAQAKLGRGDLVLGEDIGELAETIRMLKSPFKDLRQFLTKDHQKNLKKLQKLLKFQKSGTFGTLTGKRAAKAAASTWLEFRYGWNPFIGVIEDLVKQVDKAAREFDPSKIRSAKANIAREEKYRGPFSASVLGGGRTVGEYKRTDTWTAHASIQYRQTRPYTFLENLGLSPRFLPETMWNLTTLSFVVDWLFSIGPWLESLRIHPEIEELGNTVGVKLARITKLQASKFETGLTNPVGGESYQGKGEYRYFDFERFVNVEPPLTPSWRVGDVFDLFKQIDSVALLISRLLK